MRFRSRSSEGHDAVEGGGIRGRIQKFLNGNRSPTSANTTKDTKSALDGPLPVEEEPQEVFSFREYLELERYSEASQLLIDRENQLFLNTNESQPLPDWDREVDELHSQHRDLESALMRIFVQSLNPDLSTRILTSAAAALTQENLQDSVWTRQNQARSPPWRPAGLQKQHDAKLKALVEKRMDCPTAQCSSPEATQGSSIQSDVWAMGRQMKQDLDLVLQLVHSCYPREQDICKFYLTLFHHAFMMRIWKIAEFGMDDPDCSFILRWVHEYYPGEILQKLHLPPHIKAKDFGKLLPPTLLLPLEEQYLFKQRMDTETFIDKALNEAKQAWLSGEMPQTDEGCFVSDTAYDIIQVVNGAVKTTQTVLDDCSKAQSLTSVLQELLLRYKGFLNEVMRSNRSNSAPTVKANLHCINQFSNVLVKQSDLFPEDVRASCLSTLKEMQLSAQNYLLGPVHAELRPLYKKLSTDFLSGANFKKLLQSIESKSLDLQGLAAGSQQELMAQFHLEVTVEYVKRLIRADKLRDAKKQQEAHDCVQRDAHSLQQLFQNMGSQEQWLKDVLVRVAELLRLQDLAALQMHVASMGTSYPDLSEKHVSALLKLKYNFSKANRQTVKETLRDMLSEPSPTNTTTITTVTFFSLIPV